MNVINKIKNRLKKSFNSDKSRTFYILGLIFLLTSLVVFFLLPDWLILLSTTTLLTLCFFMLGFLVWYVPFLYRTWTHEFGKIIISVVHIFILLTTTVLARYLLTESIGLPGKDFEVSVGFLTFILYLPVWVWVSSIVFGVGFYLINFFKIDKSIKSSNSGHVLGSIGTFFVLYALFLLTNNSESLHSMVRILAFYSDYESAANYPDTKPNERICFHQNGVISSAWHSNGDVVISVRKTEAK